MGDRQLSTGPLFPTWAPSNRAALGLLGGCLANFSKNASIVHPLDQPSNRKSSTYDPLPQWRMPDTSCQHAVGSEQHTSAIHDVV
mmetsp:Transcript_17275/g.52226  ORF Transcript_17275/g.52226 Transcript_17275/m.52226 type:complete len:85 (-) Transcript_17275:2120-2374(-)